MVNFKEIVHLPELGGGMQPGLVLPVQDDGVANGGSANKMRLAELAEWLGLLPPDGALTNIVDIQPEEGGQRKYVVTYRDGSSITIETGETGKYLPNTTDSALSTGVTENAALKMLDAAMLYMRGSASLSMSNANVNFMRDMHAMPSFTNLQALSDQTDSYMIWMSQDELSGFAMAFGDDPSLHIMQINRDTASAKFTSVHGWKMVGGTGETGQWLPNSENPESTGVTDNASVAVKGNAILSMPGDSKILLDQFSSIGMEESTLSVDGTYFMLDGTWVYSRESTLKFTNAGFGIVSKFEEYNAKIKDLPLLPDVDTYMVLIDSKNNRGTAMAFTHCQGYPELNIMHFSRSNPVGQYTTALGWVKLGGKAEINALEDRVGELESAAAGTGNYILYSPIYKSSSTNISDTLNATTQVTTGGAMQAGQLYIDASGRLGVVTAISGGGSNKTVTTIVGIGNSLDFSQGNGGAGNDVFKVDVTSNNQQITVPDSAAMIVINAPNAGGYATPRLTLNSDRYRMFTILLDSASVGTINTAYVRVAGMSNDMSVQIGASQSVLIAQAGNRLSYQQMNAS